MKFFLTVIGSLLLFKSSYSQKKYLNFEPLGIVLVREKDQLMNDSIEKITMRLYFEDAWKVNEYSKVDSIIRLISLNKDFFIGMYASSLIDIIGYPLGGQWGANFFFYVMDRKDMPPEPTGRVVLFLVMEDGNTGKIKAIMTPYSRYMKSNFE